MAYEGGLLADPTGFSRLKIPQKWLWAWDGLVFAMPMWEASAGPLDLVAGLTPTSITGSIVPTPSFINYEQTFPASSYYYFGDTTQFASPLYGSMTIAVMHSPLSTGQSAIWCYATEGSANAPFVLVYSLSSNSKYALWNDNNVNGPETTATYAVGTRNFVIGRRVGDHAASPTMDIMVNGLHKVTATSVALDSFWNNDGGGVVYNQAINRFGSYNGYMGNCRIGPLYVWNRALSDTEIDALWDDPYGPIRQISQEYSFFDLTSGSTDVTATPTAGSLALTGAAPTVFGNAGASPSAQSVTLSGFAPAASSGAELTPGAQSVALSGLAPTLLNDHVLAVDTTGALSITGAAPTVFGDANASPDAQSVVISGLAPSVSSDQVLTPAAQSLTLTLFAPTVISTPDALTPASQSITITGQTPTVTTVPDPPVYVGVGTVATGDHDDVLSPGLHGSVATGDLLITIAFLRNAGTLAISGGWTQHSLVDTTANGIGYYLETWYRFATGSGDAATVTPSSGSTSPQSLTCSFTLAFRNVHTSTPFGIDGADSFNAGNANIGPITHATPTEPVGAVIVFGVRTGTVGTGIATLSGDSLTWVEAVESFSTVNGLGISVACDYAIWSGSAPTLTDKTYTVTGGASSPGMGKMFMLNAPSAAGADVNALPGAGSVTITGRVPVMDAGATLAPSTQSVTLTGQVPTLAVDANVGPSTASIAISGLVPEVVGGHDIAVGAGALTITGYEPATANDIEATPDSQAVAITGYAPTVTADQTVTAGAQALAIAGLEPTLLISNILVAGAQALEITGYQASADFVNALPETGSLTLEGFGPALVADAVVYPGSGTVVIGYPGGVLGSPGMPMQYVNTPDLTPSTPRFVWSH